MIRTGGATGPFVVAIEASHLVHDLRGIGRYVRALLPRFIAMRDGLRLILFVRGERDGEPIRTILRELGVPADRAEVRLRRDIGNTSADVFWYPWNIAIPAPERGVVVATIHDVAPLALPDPRWWKLLKNLRWRRRYRATVDRATLVITDSAFSATEIGRTLGFPLDRIRVTPLAADDGAIPDAARDAAAMQRLGVRSPFFLVVGAADRRKNIGLVERAMPRIVDAFPEARLVLAGPRRRQSADEPSWRQTLGFVSDDDLVSLYRSARALIAPSSYEGFGLPVLEALRLGTPVISARAASLPEVAGDGALYVGVQDDEALATAAKRLLGDDALHASLREAGLAHSSRFSWDETARQTLAAFEEAAAMERGAPAESAAR
ncbi:MAG TPA: glycosyltransferase family 1 protein [Gemmatimonadaceae bacterium]|jgi:glycosyltransferase involved in cell wall biosynthesis|nr:glycosyltransferase family 1 protein [Gemmatimonadaceae bacterium]